MNIPRLLIVFVLTVLPLSWAMAGQSAQLTAQERAWLQNRIAPLRVHNEQDWPPYNFFEDGQPKGYSIDYMNLLADKLGLKIEYVSGPTWDEFLGMMKKRTLDVMLNTASTKERRAYLSFTQPYYITSVGLYTRKEVAGISDLGDLAGKRLAFPKGFFFEEFIRNYYPDIIITPFDSAPASFRAVAAGQADAVMDIPGVARRILSEEKLADLKYAGKVSDPRFITTFSIATERENQILRDILQKGMDVITPEEERELARKWNLRDTANDPSLLPPDDRAYLQTLGRLRHCAHPDLLPLEALTLDGTHTGVASEFSKMLAENLGIPIKLAPTQSWRESLDYLRTKRCDVLLAVAKSPAQELGKDAIFTAPWLQPELVVATGPDQIYISDIKQVLGKKLGVAKGSPAKAILASAFPGIELTETETVSQGLREVEKGRLFGFIDLLPIVGRAIQMESLKGVKISGNLGLTAKISIGLNADDKRLHGVLERSLASLDHDAISNVYKRWQAVAYVERIDYSYLWQLLTGVGAIGLFIFYHYRKNLKVTAALRDAHAKVEAVNKSLDEKNQALDKMARTDQLTGLFNRLMIDETLNEELKRFQRYGTSFSIILLDIDHFKAINDRLGHQEGDRVLVGLARHLKNSTRESDVVGRWGGEEFLIICPSTPAEGAHRLAESLRKEMTKLDGGPAGMLSASFGVACIQEQDSVIDLVQRADEALYHAKRQGRNQVCGQGG